MEPDLRAMYEVLAAESGTSSLVEFADWFFQETNVSLGSILSADEQAELMSRFGDGGGMLEGMDSGP